MRVNFTVSGGDDLQKRLNELPSAVSLRVQVAALKQAAKPIRDAAAAIAPRDEQANAPHMADNIIIAVPSKRSRDAESLFDQAVVEVGPSQPFFYGCVFGARTYISTNKGQKAICQVHVGDMVLTQTGDYRAVTATTRYPATEKPDLVTITSSYRSERNHTLTLTRDHKVLVFRSGKFQWIVAGEINIGDTLSHRRAKSWSEGTAKSEERVCAQCGQQYVKRNRIKTSLPIGSSQGKRFCSSKCRAVWLAATHRGMRRTGETKERIATAARKRFADHPELHPNIIMAAKGFQTSHEKVVAEWLVKRGIEFIPQHRLGTKIVDFYLPESHSVIEADGAFWHQDQGIDVARDAGILEHSPDVHIVHMHFVDPRFTPKDLNRHPLPNVTYVPCNPGPASFVDPETFEDSSVLAVNHWQYQPKKSERPAMLYDLTVDGIPSFVASGLVIHNSFQELGTAFHPAQPFMRPAFDANHAKSLAIAGREIWGAIRKRLGLGGGRSASGGNL